MQTTAPAARLLRALPQETACGVLQAVENAAREAASGRCPDRCRAIIPGVLWRLEHDGLRVSFGLAGGDVVIAALSTASKGKGRKR